MFLQSKILLSQIINFKKLCLATQYLFYLVFTVIIFDCSGFGFVTYKSAEAAKKAIDDLEKTLGVSKHFNFYIKSEVSHEGRTCYFYA